MENMVNNTFWKGRRVFLTGHTGFKGSWLSLWLQGMGANVIGYSLPPPTNPSLFEIARMEKGMISIIGDIRDFESLKSAIASHQPEIIMHFAAQSLVRYSYAHPVETYTTNVIGTVNLLEAARQIKSAKVILIVTSDKCYENKEWLWGYRENDPMGGHDPYSSSKGCAELITAAYRNSFFSKEDYERHGIAVASVRAGNVIGGGDWAVDRLIPDIMKALMEKHPVLIRNPHAVRPWQYVLEPLHGYLLLTERLWADGKGFSGAWNFGPRDDDVRPVSWIVERLTLQWGNGARWELDATRNPGEAQYLKLDSSKARGLLGWTPKLDLTTALQRVVKWYRGYQQRRDMRQITEEEIELYGN